MDHVTRNALAARKNEAQGLGNSKFKWSLINRNPKSKPTHQLGKVQSQKINCWDERHLDDVEKVRGQSHSLPQQTLPTRILQKE